MSTENNSSALPKVDYEALEKERAMVLQRDIQLSLANQQLGKIDSLRHAVLKSVVTADYEKAELDLDRFIQMKSEYPNFYERVKGPVQHCKELINAIRAKRGFPNLSVLSMSKQQEILNHVLEHFEELKAVLKHIEKVSREVTLDDLRSTVIVLRVLSYGVIGIVGLAFFMDFTTSIGQPLVAIFHDITNVMFDWVSPKIGF